VARTDDDSWDLASSVGATATMVAAARALATKNDRKLINDPFADPLVRAVGMDFFTRMIDGEIDISVFPGATEERVQAMIDGMALRTKFFDDYFRDAGDSGLRQAVIVASGLDSRAYRLAWPTGTTVYEIDQPQVIQFKTATLERIGAEPTAVRRTVPTDLRDDWPAALRVAGLDPSAATAWCVEGLLIYLPGEAQDRLFDEITALSAAGSTIATEYVPGMRDFDPAPAAQATAQAMRDQGLDLDMSALVYTGERSHVIEYLRGIGWDVTGVPRGELFTRNDIAPPEPDETDPLGEIVYVSGTLAR
jgi:methyltransferase (TIGR00027 family)